MQMGEGVEWALHPCVVLAVVPPDRRCRRPGWPSTTAAARLPGQAPAGAVARPGSSSRSPAAAAGTAWPGRPPRSPCSTSSRPSRAPRRRSAARRSASAARPPSPGAVPGAVRIARVMWAAEAAWRDELAATTVLDLVVGVAGAASPVSIRRSAAWLQEAIR